MKFLPVILVGLTACATVGESRKYDRQTVLSVSQLNCQGCGQNIVNALQASPGVDNASFDKEAVEVTIGFRQVEVTPEQLLKVVRGMGFGAEIGTGKGSYKSHVEFDKGLDVKWLTKTGEAVKVEEHRVEGKVTVIDFGAEWCGPCRQVDDMMLRLMRKAKDVALRKIDVVDWDTPVAKAYLNKAPELPYVIIYGKDGREITRFPGLDLDRLRKAIEQGRNAP